MAKIHAMLDIGKRSMMNSQTALQTVAHNISNKTTEGYSRQRLDQVTNAPIVEGRAVLGMGARTATVSRVVNPFVDKQLMKETHNLGYLDGQSQSLGRVEEVFNEQVNKGLNKYITDFFNSWRELSNNPESISIRTMVREAGESLAQDFSRVHRQLTDIQKDIDSQVQGHVLEINKIVKDIADLNEKISSIEIQGLEANDQKDRREYLLKQLNEKIDIKVAESNNGMVKVSTAGNAILVSGYDHIELTTYSDNETGRTNIYCRPSDSYPPFDITKRIRGGQIGGVLQVRDETINELKNRMDELAYNLVTRVNEAHLQGYDRQGRAGNLFFANVESVNDLSKNIKLSNEVSNDVGKIVAGAKPGSPGDNTVANVISLLQYREVMEDGTATLDDFYTSQVGRLGVIASRSIKTRETQDNIVQQITKLRDSISGVSLDEEATKMIEYQKAFDASARVIRTADEMFDTILNLKRM